MAETGPTDNVRYGSKADIRLLIAGMGGKRTLSQLASIALRGVIQGVGMRRLKAIFTASEQEYQAALNGLSIFFGAILGVALGGVEELEPLPYMTLLVMVSGVVLGILYIPASRHRVAYAVGLIALLTVLLITHELGDMILNSFPLPGKLIPTLIVWTAATILVEFGPRSRQPTANQ